MRLTRLLGTTALPAVLFLGGCSGLGKFLGDTITIPGMNPNLPYGISENSDRSRGLQPAVSPILPQPGNMWPGPPQPLPTLNQASHEQAGELSGNLGHADTAPMHDGGSMSMGEGDAIAHGATSGADSFSGGGPGAGASETGAPGASTPRPSALGDHVPDASSRYRVKMSPGKGDTIVIPNGDGTSTVIGPDGTVKTVKDAPK